MTSLLFVLALGIAQVPDGGVPASEGRAALDAGVPASAGGAVKDDGGVPAPAGRVVVDGGAPSVERATEDAGVTRPEAVVVSVHERPTPLSFRVPRLGKSARARARDAGAALAAALEADAVEGAPAAEVRVVDDVAVVDVHGRSVATLTEADAAAEGATLERYAAELDTRMASFVKEEERRSSLQALALRIFFSVLVCVLGLVTLRTLRKAFTAWETRLEERVPTSPLRIFGQPVLSSDAFRGLLAAGLLGARLLAYVVVAGVVVGAVLGQFEATRPVLKSLGGWAAAPLVHGINGLVGAVPGLVLAAILLVAVRAGLRFVQLLLDGVAQGRVPSRVIGPGRVFPVRVAVGAGVALLAAPLVIAAAFGRFGTPLETLALAAGGCALLSSVPVLASAAAGVVLLWRGTVKPGDWVEVGTARGEVAAVNLIDVLLVPDHGGTIHVPHLSFMFMPVKQLKAPRAELDVVVRRDRAMDKLDAALRAVAKRAGADGGVELLDARGTSLHCCLFVPMAKPGAREALVRALVEAVERGDLALADGES